MDVYDATIAFDFQTFRDTVRRAENDLLRSLSVHCADFGPVEFRMRYTVMPCQFDREVKQCIDYTEYYAKPSWDHAYYEMRTALKCAIVLRSMHEELIAVVNM